MNERQPINEEKLSPMQFEGELLVFGWEEENEIRWVWGIEDDEVKELASQRNITVPPYELYEGDKLTVFDKSKPNKVIWEGLLEFSEGELDKVGYVPTNIDLQDWSKWFKQHYHVKLHVGMAGYQRQLLKNQLQSSIQSIDRFQLAAKRHMRQNQG